jgi:hypothetical protein
MRRHLRAAIAGLEKPRPLIAYVGVASDDNAGFFSVIRAGLALGTARMRLCKIASPRAKKSEARALLEAADLVFVSGGDVDHGMTVLHERDFASTLRRLAREGKPMFGISAGSIMLSREWVRFTGADETEPELFPCLGIAPVYVDAHSEDDDWSELRVLLRLVEGRGHAGDLVRDEVAGYGLTRKGGLLVCSGRDGVALSALGTPIPKLVARRGRVAHRSPLMPA